jgi:hypothetical protein
MVALCGTMSGCMTASEKLEHKLKLGETVSRAYPARYEDVESAVKQAMIKYPQRVDNTEAGIFETDFVKGDTRFKAPQSNADFSSGYRYRLLLRLVRGKSDAKPAVQVLVTKQVEIARDFFQTPEPVQSDGLEENVILYRIARELSIAKAMSRSNERANEKPSIAPD